MALVGAYTLDLYCDTGGDDFGGNCPHRAYFGVQGEFVGHTERDCIKQARKSGWTFNRELTQAFCPDCSKSKRKNRKE